ncbi:MAG: NAD(P)H-hydrate dehydratase [Bacilli bacterium]|nr:NAD(P)H-hydrate dehydratase [Bacilli bacterium]
MKEYIISTTEAKLIDQMTCEVKGLTNLDLIKAAGHALTKVFLERCQPNNEQIITILAGPGHNGADGLMMGSLLLKANLQVNFVLISSKIKPENQEILQDIEKAKANVYHLEDNFSLIQKLTLKSDFLIDAIFGTGLNQEIDGLPKKLIESLPASAYIFSIDIPSGINGDNGLIYGTSVKANFTAIIQNYKVGNLINDALDYHGEKSLVDIGLFLEDFSKYYLDAPFIEPFLKRKHNTHKYDYGNILIIGGSVEMKGAPQLAASAALRTGSGLVSQALPSECLTAFNSNYPEIITYLYEDLNQLISLLKKRDAVAFGPGLGRKNPLSKAILNEILQLDIPLVIDADGLFYLKPYLEQGIKLNNQIITPHLGEFAALVGKEIKEVHRNCLEIAKELSNKHNLTIVLKGPCTMIVNKDEAWFSDLGNPGMATAGSGDVLTGIITSLLAQKHSLLEAAKIGVYLHCLAGNLAKNQFGEVSMVASDIVKMLPKVIKSLE